MFGRKKQVIKGYDLPSPRLTGTALRLMMVYIALPMIVGLALIDVILFLVFKYAFGSCYGMWCLF